jgi:hypothetical protein
MGADSFQKYLENESDLKQRMMWRYRLEWRDNKRLNQLLKEWNKDWGYWWLAKGSVTEKINLELREKQKNADMQGLTVLDRIQEDLDSTPEGTPMPDRDQWKADAMKRVAQKHQEDYERDEFEVNTCTFESLLFQSQMFSVAEFFVLMLLSNRIPWVSPFSKRLELDSDTTLITWEIWRKENNRHYEDCRLEQPRAPFGEYKNSITQRQRRRS